MYESTSEEADCSNKSTSTGLSHSETASSKTQAKSASSTLPDISMKHFLEFLATAYRLNDALENCPLETFKKSNSIDWNQLNNCTFVSVLLQNNFGDRQCNKQSYDRDHDSVIEEVDSNSSSKQNGVTNLSHDNFQPFEQGNIDRVEEECKPVIKQNTKRGEKHKRGRSASIGGNNITSKGDKSKLDKRRSSFTKRENSDNKGKSRSEVNITERHIKRKLSEVLQEGILDSVLPYVIPKQNGNLSPKKPLSVIEKKNSYEKTSGSMSIQSKENIAIYHSKKQNFMLTDNNRDSAKDIEVEIHVCDEVKNMKKDFRCSQKLLVSKMGYFAEVTTGQNLEDMDISVHCDITIFEWLMRWVKKDSSIPELAPQLDAANVIPVLVSAAFLQMDPLLNDCLLFCQEHMNEILKLATNLSCLNDSIITRLASQFTNIEIEEMRDKRDKLQSRLFCKLISFLGEPEPDHKRGHFASLAYMFKCAHCHKLLPQSVSTQVTCRPSSNRINSLGQLQGVHPRNTNWGVTEWIKQVRSELGCWRGVYWRFWGKTHWLSFSVCHAYYPVSQTDRNTNWGVTEWIKQVRSELGCWRGVYWRLWGKTHWLSCSVCHAYYPVSQTDWCCYHPDSPQFFIMEQHRTMSFPIGRYPCCGERAYRFEVLQNSNGCTYRSHVPIVDSNVSFAIQKIFQTYRHAIALEPPHTVFQERLTRLVRCNRDGSNVEDSKDCVQNSSLWWHGLELAPTYHKTALISRIWEKPKDSKAKVNWIESCVQAAGQPVYSEVSGSSENATSSPDDTERDSSPSLGEDNSEDSLLCNSPVHKTNKKNCSMFVYSPNQPNQWLARYSTRYNQDSLRDYEEWSLGTVVSLLSRRHGDLYQRGAGRGKWGPHITPLARYSKRYNQDSLRYYEELSLGTVGSLLSRRHGDLYQRGAGRGKWEPHITPLGGTYVRLEAQWREGHLHLYQGTRVPVISNPRGRPIVSSRARPRSNLR